jgi:hypothetical protein
MNDPNLQAFRRAAARLTAAYSRSPGWADDFAHACVGLIRGHTDTEIAAAAEAWIDAETRHPTPAAFRELVRRRAASGRGDTSAGGCGRCSAEGFREVAVHRTRSNGKAECVCFVAHCDCPLGGGWARRRAEPTEGGGEHKPGVMLSDFVASARNHPSTLEVYVDPTAEQKVTPDERERLALLATTTSTYRQRYEHGVAVARNAHARAGKPFADDQDHCLAAAHDRRLDWEGAGAGDAPLDEVL